MCLKIRCDVKSYKVLEELVNLEVARRQAYAMRARTLWIPE